MRYHDILRGYVRDYAVPAMLEEGWAFKPAKSYAWKQAKRGPEYHIDQPLRTHILNGLYALTRLVEYLTEKGYCQVSEKDFKRILVLYTLHDAYKDSNLTRTRTGNSDFSVPLTALEALIERMGLRAFIDVTAEDVRIASVSLLSPKIADLSSATTGISRLLTFIHLADAFASQQTARDCGTAENRIRDITRHDAVTDLIEKRTSKRTGMLAPIQDIRPELKFYYHELNEYRGLSTLLIHQATEEALAPFGFYPILYFANSILYLGPQDIEVDTETLRKAITIAFFEKIKQDVGEARYEIAKDACDPRKGMKIEKYAYLFCSFDDLLSAVQEKTSLTNTVGFLRKLLTTRLDAKKYDLLKDFYELYAIPLNADENEAQAQAWFATSKLVMVAENIASGLVPGDTLGWLFAVFKTPALVANTIRQNSKNLRDGGVSDHCIIIAYHWLITTPFTEERRTWLEVRTIDVQKTVTMLILRELKEYEKVDHLLSFVEKELGIQNDIKSYLRSNLIFSFAPERFPDESPLKEYKEERRKSHKRICVICNRLITNHINKKNSEIKTTIADQQALVFSNKVVPTAQAQKMMVWCPMCYLEFMLRKLSGQSYPAGSNYASSYRLHLYVLPDYSFTPQLWEYTGQQLLRNFHPKETTVSRLVLRGSKDDPSLPARWLTKRRVDPEWLEQIRDMFSNQAAYLKTPTKEGKQRKKQGDRLTFSFKNPNYMLITYDNVVAEKADKSLLPTHVEVWTKALYSATLIHLLTGARVYITDKPYLTITRPEEMKTIIEMEGLHPLLTGLLPLRRPDEDLTDVRPPESSTRLPIATIPAMLDLLAAVWEINAGLNRGKVGESRNLDKQVANILEEVKTNYLAGATLYKMRERDKAPPYAEFTRACQILLPQQGDQADEVRRNLYMEGFALMIDQEGSDLMSLAARITDTSLQLYSPSDGKDGRAHRFETLFRTGVEAIKNNASSSEDDNELISRVAGTVLKRLERITDEKGYFLMYEAKRLEVTETFATILVKELFGNLCGRSVSKLTHEENNLADAIYFLTSQKKNLYREEWRKQHPNQTEKVNSEK